MKAVRFERHGGPEVLELNEVARPEPNADKVLVRLEAVGLNYPDTYHGVDSTSRTVLGEKGRGSSSGAVEPFDPQSRSHLLWIVDYRVKMVK